MAVIKCNGYGHGLVGTAKALEKLNIQHFAVVKVPEAVDLRNNKINGMILNFGSFSRSEAEQLVQHDISQSVFSETVEILAAAAHKLKKPGKVQPEGRNKLYAKSRRRGEGMESCKIFNNNN